MTKRNDSLFRFNTSKVKKKYMKKNILQFIIDEIMMRLFLELKKEILTLYNAVCMVAFLQSNVRPYFI